MTQPFSIDPEDLKGSALGELLKGLNDSDGVFIAPRIGVNFVEPWTVVLDD